MHDIVEMRCTACGFTVRGVHERTMARRRTCALCGLPAMAPRSNFSISRRLPMGMGLLMGAFAASLDVSPLEAAEPDATPGFARQHA